MSKLLENALIILAVVFVLGVAVIVRVAPYGWDWKCLVAECRISK